MGSKVHVPMPPKYHKFDPDPMPMAPAPPGAHESSEDYRKRCGPFVEVFGAWYQLRLLEWQARNLDRTIVPKEVMFQWNIQNATKAVAPMIERERQSENVDQSVMDFKMGGENKPTVAKVNGVVNAAYVHFPKIVSTVWFKHWGLQCGACKKDFARFAFFGKPKCPFCGVRNSPNFESLGI